MSVTQKKSAVNKECYQQSFLEFCEREKYTNLVPLDEGASTFTFTVWPAPVGGLWGIMYFLTDTLPRHERRHMYLSEADALGVVTRLCGNRELRKLSYKSFLNELVRRASQNKG